MNRGENGCNTTDPAGTLPARTRRAKMSSKLTLSILAAIAISAAGSVARANPIPTSTDEARALYGQVTSQYTDHTAQADVQVTSTDDARAQAGSSAPPPSSASAQALIG